MVSFCGLVSRRTSMRATRRVVLFLIVHAGLVWAPLAWLSPVWPLVKAGPNGELGSIRPQHGRHTAKPERCTLQAGRCAAQLGLYTVQAGRCTVHAGPYTAQPGRQAAQFGRCAGPGRQVCVPAWTACRPTLGGAQPRPDGVTCRLGRRPSSLDGMQPSLDGVRAQLGRSAFQPGRYKGTTRSVRSPCWTARRPGLTVYGTAWAVCLPSRTL